MAGGEDRLLRWLARRMPRPLLIGDDAAVLPGVIGARGAGRTMGVNGARGGAGGSFAVTMDSQIAGVHFAADLDAAWIARRLLAVNLSDLAAMGASPAYGFLALTAPPDFAHRKFFSALLAACAPHRLRLAGGDLSRGADRSSLAATLTLLGGKPRGGCWLRRSAARPGQRLWLGGTVGESAAGRLLVAAGARPHGGGVRLPAAWLEAPRERHLAAAARRAVLRHLRPQPQLALGRWLGRQPAAAAMDVSDGLALDLSRLCAASGTGARIDRAQLPMAAHAGRLCGRLEVSAEQLALAGGEDYVLLFTLPAGIEPPARFGCHAIGTIEAHRRLLIVDDGKARELRPEGWDHLTG